MRRTVHVGLRAAASLPDLEREMRVMEPGGHLKRGLLDDRAHGVARGVVCARGSGLDEGERVDQRQRHVLGDAADLEIVEGPLRLQVEE